MTKDHRAFDVSPSISFRLFNKQEMAKLLGCTERTIDRLIAARRIPYLRIPAGSSGKTRVRFDSRDIERWLARDRQEVDESPQRPKRESSREFWTKFRAAKELSEQSTDRRSRRHE